MLEGFIAKNIRQTRDCLALVRRESLPENSLGKCRKILSLSRLISAMKARSWKLFRNIISRQHQTTLSLSFEFES